MDGHGLAPHAIHLNPWTYPDFHSRLNKRLRDIGNTISQLQCEAQALQAQKAAVSPVLARLVPVQVMPHPFPFDGSLSSFGDWLNLVDTKIERDGAAIGDTTARFDYLIACLTPPVRRALNRSLDQDAKSPAALGDALMSMLGVPKDDLRPRGLPSSADVQDRWRREHRCTRCGSWMHSHRMCPQAMSPDDSRLVENMSKKRRKCGDNEAKGKEVVQTIYV